MLLSFKNKWFASLMVILTMVSFNGMPAAPKTFVKDASGRVLIYRKGPTNLVWFASIILSAMSGPVLYTSLTGKGSKDNADRIFAGFLGIIVAPIGTLNLGRCYYKYNSLYKPLIAIDKHGITYEGKKKILWRKVSKYYTDIDNINSSFRLSDSGLLFCLAIITDAEELRIYEDDIAITVEELKEFIDEAYAEYKNSVNEKDTSYKG